MASAATIELRDDEFKAASLSAPVGWAYDTDPRWNTLVTCKWRKLCEATSCGSGGLIAHTGKRAVAAAIAFTFWPGCFDKRNLKFLPFILSRTR